VGSSISYRLTDLDDGGGGGDIGGPGDGNRDTGIKIDPALLRNGQVATSLAAFAEKNGIDKDAMSRAFEKGDALGLAAQHTGTEDSQLQDALDAARANPLSADDARLAASELGMDFNGDGSLLADGDGSGQSGSGLYSLAGGVGGGGGRGLASDSLLGGAGAGGAGGAGGTNLKLKGSSNGKVSKDIQAALDRAGISHLTIFQIVHRQYVKKTPMFFGTDVKTATPQANPFAKSPFEGLANDPSNLSL
jgi:hypothetical protein